MAAALLWLLPIATPVLVLLLDAERLTRIAASVLLLPVAAVSVVMSAVCVMEAQEVRTDGGARGLAPLSTVELDVSRLVAYQTNSGATTSYGLEVRQEWEFLPGLVLTRVVHGEYPCGVASLERRSGKQVVVHGCGTTLQLELSRFVYP
jgi:hypothetical protein